MSYITASSTFTPYLSYDFTGRVPKDIGARHAFLQAQAPLTKVEGGGGRVVTDANGQQVPVPLFFETNDLLQTTANASNVIQIFGDATLSAPPFTQKRSGLLTTVDAANRVTVQNQRDVTSYVVGDPSIYNTQFATIQQAIDQAILDGVDVSATPKREAQILIKPGTYPDDILLPRHGISLIALATGVCKDVTITGTLTVAPLDSPAKTSILLQGLHFAPSNPAAVIVTTPIAFNPKILMQECLVEGDINLNGVLSNVEFSARTSNLGNISMTSPGTLVSVFLDNCSAGTIFIQSFAAVVVLQNQSQCGLTSFGASGNPPLLVNNTAINVQNSSIAGGLNELAGTDHSNQIVSLLARNSSIQLTAFGQFSNLELSNCVITSGLTLGDATSLNADNLFTQGPLVSALIQNCIFNGVSATLTMNMKTSNPNLPQNIAIEHCTFASIPGAFPNCNFVDSSPAFIASSANIVVLRECTLRTPIQATGPNLQVTLLQGVHDITDTNVDAGGGNFPIIYGGSAISPTIVRCYNNTFTLRQVTANDFVIYGVNPIDWTYRTQLPGGFPCNLITNLGATAANASGGVVAIVDAGYSLV